MNDEDDRRTYKERRKEGRKQGTRSIISTDLGDVFVEWKEGEKEKDRIARRTNRDDRAIFPLVFLRFRLEAKPLVPD
jgi:hypothetical protein